METGKQRQTPEELLESLTGDWARPEGKIVGLSIDQMDREELRNFLEMACRDDLFYMDARVVTYEGLEGGRPKCQIVHTDNVPNLLHALVDGLIANRVKYYSVPAFFREYFGTVPQRTLEDSARMEAVVEQWVGEVRRGLGYSNEGEDGEREE